MNNDELLLKIKKLNKKIYKKQKKIIKMRDFYGIDENDKKSLKNYIDEIDYIEMELEEYLEIYKKRKRIIKELNKNL